MTKTDLTLIEILRDKDGESVRNYFKEMNETDRRKLAPQVYQLYVDAHSRKVENTALWEIIGPEPQVSEEFKQYAAVAHMMADLIPGMQDYSSEIKQWREKLRYYQRNTIRAMIATASLEMLEKHNIPLSRDEVDILFDRRPKWIDEYIDKFGFWEVKLILCLQGRYEMPVSKESTRFFLDNPYYKGETLAEAIQTHPRLMDEVWRFFDLTGKILYESEMYRDKAQRWSEAIIVLGKKDILERKRILKLTHDMIKKAKLSVDKSIQWPCNIHKKLGTKPKEILPFMDFYFKWSQSSHEALSPFGFDMLLLAAKESDKYDSELLERLDAPLREKSKDRASKAIALMEAILLRNELLKQQVLSLLLIAMEHDTADVQLAAFKMLSKHFDLDDAVIKAELRRVAPSLAPSVQTLLPKFSESSGGNKSPKSTIIDDMPPKQIVPYKYAPFERIETLDDFIDASLRFFENPISVDEAERLIDFMATNEPERNNDFQRKTDSLRNRATHVFGKDVYRDFFHDEPDWAQRYPKVVLLGGKLPFDEHPICDLASTVLIWLNGEMYEEIPLPKKFEEMKLYRFGDMYLGEHFIRPGDGTPSSTLFFSNRLKTSCERFCNGKSYPLLSTPTHEYCRIDPVIFSERLTDYLKSPNDYDAGDLVLALSRLAPDNRREALARLPETNDEYVSAVRYALGDDKVEIGPTAGYWITAARVRRPLESDERIAKVFPGFGPDASEPASYKYRAAPTVFVPMAVVVDVDPAHALQNEHIHMPTALPLYAKYPLIQYWRFIVEWTASLWPVQLEGSFYGAIQYLSETMDKPGSLEGHQHYFPLLARPELSFGENALMMLAIGLAHKNPEIHLPASDIVIAAISENRLDTERFSDKVGFLLGKNVAKIGRMLKQLQIIADVSRNHASVVKNILEYCVPHVSDKDLGAVSAMLYELCLTLEQGIASSATVKHLENQTGTGKAAKLAKKLLKL